MALDTPSRVVSQRTLWDKQCTYLENLPKGSRWLTKIAQQLSDDINASLYGQLREIQYSSTYNGILLSLPAARHALKKSRGYVRLLNELQRLNVGAVISVSMQGINSPPSITLHVRIDQPYTGGIIWIS